MDIIEYVKKNNIKPRKIEMNVALSSTGLDDPEIAELAYDIVTYYKDTDIPSGIDGVLTPKTPDNAGMVANSFLNMRSFVQQNLWSLVLKRLLV